MVQTGGESAVSCLVIIPTYNERENLARLVQEIQKQGPEYDVLIVDDNSPDGTGELANQLSTKYPEQVFVLHRAGKLGLGTAYMEGFHFALARNYDYIFEMDADFSHQPQYLPKLLQAAQRNGVAIGSRLIPGGGVGGWPWYRKAISRGGSLYARLILGLKVHDCTSGYKCFSREALQNLVLSRQVSSSGFGFQVEVNWLCEKSGFKVTEVPIFFPDRVLGKSKMNRKIFFEAMLMVWTLRLGRSTKRPAGVESEKAYSEGARSETSLVTVGSAESSESPAA